MSDAQAPTWRYLVPGLLFIGLAGYLLVTGEIAVDRAQNFVITRTSNPVIYWSAFAVSATLGALALRKVWQRLSA